MNRKHDGPLSNFAFNCNLRHYTMAVPLASPDVLRNGSVVSVRDPLWQATCMMCAYHPGCPGKLLEALKDKVTKMTRLKTTLPLR